MAGIASHPRLPSATRALRMGVLVVAVGADVIILSTCRSRCLEPGLT